MRVVASRFLQRVCVAVRQVMITIVVARLKTSESVFFDVFIQVKRVTCVWNHAGQAPTVQSVVVVVERSSSDIRVRLFVLKTHIFKVRMNQLGRRQIDCAVQTSAHFRVARVRLTDRVWPVASASEPLQ